MPYQLRDDGMSESATDAVIIATVAACMVAAFLFALAGWFIDWLMH
jgi:hypothetical protein